MSAVCTSEPYGVSPAAAFSALVARPGDAVASAYHAGELVDAGLGDDVAFVPSSPLRRCGTS